MFKQGIFDEMECAFYVECHLLYQEQNFPEKKNRFYT